MNLNLDIKDESATISLVFCNKCDSYSVDVNSQTTDGKAIFECSNCGHWSLVEGFTIGRVRNGTPEQLAEAQLDRPKKSDSDIFFRLSNTIVVDK